MLVAGRRLLLSLLIVVVVLLLTMGALLKVSLSRRQRLEDVTTDFQRNLKQQQGQIDTLRKLLEDCDTTALDTAVGNIGTVR